MAEIEPEFTVGHTWHAEYRRAKERVKATKAEGYSLNPSIFAMLRLPYRPIHTRLTSRE
jgi:hypothetical protein